MIGTLVKGAMNYHRMKIDGCETVIIIMIAEECK